MPSRPVRRATALPSPLANPSPITRDDMDGVGRVRARARAYTGGGAATQVPAIMGKSVETAGQALVAALVRTEERRTALAAAVAAARAVGVPDVELRARLLIARLDQVDIDAALAEG